MKIAVNPQSRPAPRRRRERMLPGVENRRAIDATFKLLETAMQQSGAVGKRHASPRVRRRFRRGRPMQRTQELRDRSRGGRGVELRRAERRFPGKPGHDRPSPREAAPRTSNTDRRRNRNRQVTRELREPALLVFNQLGGGRTARQTHRELVAETKHEVVPSLDALTERQFAQVGMLLAQQLPHDRCVDVDFGARTAESYLRTVPVTPSGEQLNGSIFKSDAAYSIVACEKGCVKKSGSVISISTTSR